MAYDIGPKIGIEGEAEFRKAITQINQNVKTLGTEMAAVTSAYDKNDQSAENLTKQNEVLNKQIAAQRDKLKQVKDMLVASAKETGENSEQTQKWRAVVNTATADLNKMERQLRENNEAMKGQSSGLGALKEKLSSLGSNLSDTLKVAGGNLISSGVQALVSGVGQAVSAFVNLDKSTEEYRIAQGKLNTAFEAAGKSTESAKETYTEFYKILGDTGTAAEASQLLAKLADDEEDLSKWTKISAGVYGTFGDALPINGLIEAANETAKTGKVTGVLADALNWAGISEDEFNAQLAAASDESERNQMLMEALSGVYDEAGDAFYRNNDAIIKSRETQAKLDEVTGRLGESVGKVKNALVEKFGPALLEIGNKIAEFIEGIDTEELFRKFDEAWKSIKAVWDTVADYFSLLWDTISEIFSVVESVLSGDFQGAWDSIQGIFDDWNKFFTGLWEDVGEIFSNVGSFFLGIGSDIVAGIKKGISDAWSGLKEWVSGKFNGLVDGVKDFLGIHSPSTVFAGIGENMAAGLGVGWRDEIGSVQRNIDRSMASLLPGATVPAGIQPGGATGGSLGGSVANSDMVAAIQQAMAGMGVYMSGRKVGKLVTAQQTQDGRASGGFAPVRG